MDNDVLDHLQGYADKRRKVEEGLTEAKQVRKIIPIDEWLQSRYHIGSMADNLYPYWYDELCEFYTGGYNEWIITGSKGAGKTVVSVLAMLRKIYELSCYEFPQRIFNFPDVSVLGFVYLSVKSSIARKTGFNTLKNYIDEAQYFQEKFPRDQNINYDIILPENLIGVFGSNLSALLSLDALVVGVDEAGFFRKGGSGSVGSVEQVKSIYSDARERRKTRFTDNDIDEGEDHPVFQTKNDPGFTLLISSATHNKSFVEERRSKGGDTTYISQARAYEVKPSDYPDEKFVVFKGNEDQSPEIVDDLSTLEAIIDDVDEGFEFVAHGSVQDTLHHLPDYLFDLFVEVPVNFRQEFESDIISSLQGIAGEPVSESGNFFSNIEVWNKALNEDYNNPWIREEVTLSTGDDKPLRDYFKTDLFTSDGEYLEPRIRPEAYRFLHIDLSTNNDPTGMAMGHIKNDQGYKSLFYDWLVRILPPKPPHQIDHEKIRSFVLWLSQELGVRFHSISMDKHGVESNLQWFNKYIFGVNDDREAVYLSTDSDDEMWREFVNLMFNNRIILPQHEILRQEFFNLQHDRVKNKVDHPKEFSDGTTGHNDVSCAVVGVAKLADDSGLLFDSGDYENDDEIDLLGVEDADDWTNDLPDRAKDHFNRQQNRSNQKRRDYNDSLEHDIIDLM